MLRSALSAVGVRASVRLGVTHVQRGHALAHRGGRGPSPLALADIYYLHLDIFFDIKH